MKQGPGMLTTLYGEYQGDFHDGLFGGQGKFTWKDGRTYSGEFLNGKMHGMGILTYGNGQTIKGRW
jgi:hypothetical protein